MILWCSTFAILWYFDLQSSQFLSNCLTEAFQNLIEAFYIAYSYFIILSGYFGIYLLFIHFKRTSTAQFTPISIRVIPKNFLISFFINFQLDFKWKITLKSGHKLPFSIHITKDGLRSLSLRPYSLNRAMCYIQTCSEWQKTKWALRKNSQSK